MYFEFHLGIVVSYTVIITYTGLISRLRGHEIKKSLKKQGKSTTELAIPPNLTSPISSAIEMSDKNNGIPQDNIIQNKAAVEEGKVSLDAVDLMVSLTDERNGAGVSPASGPRTDPCGTPDFISANSITRARLSSPDNMSDTLSVDEMMKATRTLPVPGKPRASSVLELEVSM